MLEDFVGTALAEIWPGGSFPKKVRLDHAERVELLRSLNVWDSKVCDAVSTFTTLRNNAMHKSSVEIDGNTIRPFLMATDYFVRAIEAEEDTPPIPVPDLGSEDGIVWALSRHLTAMLGWIYEYELEAISGKTLLLSRVAPDGPRPKINIFASTKPASPTPAIFEQKLRIVSGYEGEAKFARIGSFSTFKVDFERISAMIDQRHWSHLIGDFGIEDPVFVFVYVVTSADKAVIVVMSESHEELLIEHLDAPSRNSLLRVMPAESWRDLG